MSSAKSTRTWKIYSLLSRTGLTNFTKVPRKRGSDFRFSDHEFNIFLISMRGLKERTPRESRGTQSIAFSKCLVFLKGLRRFADMDENMRRSFVMPETQVSKVH
jgi:hypothetical protein